MTVQYPKINLAIDNCVFFKRYCTPDAWSRVIRDLGVYFIEASADTELDPLYMGAEYLVDWTKDVREAEARYGVKVANLYSGHGSYTMLGMAHPDPRARDNMVRNFIFPLIDIAAEIGSGVGFFAHAFDHESIQNPEIYAERVATLDAELARIARYAAEKGCGKVGVEKMYTPHMYPWRIDDLVDCMRAVKTLSGCDFYYTEDLGHHHTRFIRPTEAQILKAGEGGVWVGTDRAFELAHADARGNLEAIQADITQNPQMFAAPDDCDCYEVLRQIGCYSPIIHLQQTPGDLSAHLPFTAAENARGKIDGRAVLEALKASYEREAEAGMPARCDEINMTLEIFSGTTSIMADVLRDCRESVEYWRQFIPKDGMRLDELV